jgi:hypothetical protein
MSYKRINNYNKKKKNEKRRQRIVEEGVKPGSNTPDPPLLTGMALNSMQSYAMGAIPPSALKQFGIPQPLDEFDLDRLITDKDGKLIMDKAIGIFGQRGTGKTFATRYMMWHLQKFFDYGIIITGTKFNFFWQDYVPDSAIIPLEYLEQALHTMLYNQAVLVQKIKKGKLPPDTNINFFCILEDWIQDSKHARYSDIVNTLFVAGRHFRVFVVAITQYAKAISTYARGNLDFAFILRQNQNIQRQAICEDHVDMVPKGIACTLMDGETMDNGILVVDKTPQWKTLGEVFSRMKAEDPGYFKLGCKKWWEDERNKAQEDDDCGFGRQKKRTFYEIMNDFIRMSSIQCPWN